LKSRGHNKAAYLAPILLLAASPLLLACGPFFPNNMLDRGDSAVLVAPVADFYRELDRMKFEVPQFQAMLTTNSYAEEATQNEIADLRAALKKAGKSTNEVEAVVKSHLAEREKLKGFAAAFDDWKNSAPMDWVNGEERRGAPLGQKPTFPSITVVDGLPEEFADYFEGAISWNNPNDETKGLARERWEAVLMLPADQRHYKSTWAAFMLGRSWETEDPAKASGYFSQVRDLAAHGFADASGLAVEGIGWEARLALRTNDFQKAIELYLEEYESGGWGSAESLRVALGRAVNAGPDALAPLALNSKTRRLVTAYLISRRLYDESDRPTAHDHVKAWLEAVEKADVTDVESAEQFALAAYQADEMEVAQRWVIRAGNSPVAQWLQAKLFLRVGKIAPATVILSRLVESFPVDESTNEPPSFAGSLFVGNEPENDNFTVAQYVRGELGALQLSRRDYIQSLDLLLRGGFWTDAAYVADHVLTTDELKNYVDDAWPAIAPSDDDDKMSEAEKASEKLTSDIRYLLARRLTRESRGADARPYFPAEWVPIYDQFMQALTTGWNESLTADERAKALEAAAYIARTNGMELLATESGPDWHMHEGGYSVGVVTESRTNDDAKAVLASADELRRTSAQNPEPNKRYHYRYQAASLAWEAAKLMPNNSDETARLLCSAGSWLKAQDPIAADVFYKALVRRCRKTAIGEEADELRWFPDFDEDGNVIRTRLEMLDLPSAEEINSKEPITRYPIPGKYFLVQDGDHIRFIASAVRRLGIPLTEKEIFAANPDITPNDYIARRLIFIPEPGTNSEPPPPPPALPNASEKSPAAPADSAAEPAPTPMPGNGIYAIQAGDTLAYIARKFGISLRLLEDVNPGVDFRKVKIGQEISVPAAPQ
jgi:hypothetical protein